MTLRNWWIAFAAVVLAIGCGGSDGDGGGTTTTTTTTGGTTGVTAPTVNLSNASTINYTLNTGPGRRAVGDQYVFIDNIRYENEDPLDFISSQVLGAGGSIFSPLDTFDSQNLQITYTIPAGESTKTYDYHPIVISGVSRETVNNGIQPYITNNLPWTVTPRFPANMTMYRGRQTTMRSYLDSSIMQWDPVLDQLFFDQDLFEKANYEDGEIPSFISDLVAFDISSMALGARPELDEGNGPAAEMVLMSGDLVALSNGFGAQDTIELINEDEFEGNDFGVIAENLGSFAPSYFIYQFDPSDVTNTSKILDFTSLWRPYTDVFSSIGQEALIIFPNAAKDLSDMQAAFISRNGAGNITGMWVGTADLSTEPGSISLAPVKGLEGILFIPLVGTLDNYVTVDGHIAFGTFSFGGAPFTTTGEFGVFVN